MSYDFYITRADRWPETEHWLEYKGKSPGSHEITFEEWERLVEDDPELSIDYSARLSEEELVRITENYPEFAGCRDETGGFTYTKEQYERLKELARELKKVNTPNIEDLGDDTADWTAHPEGEQVCFWFGDGSISTKSPDMATLDKMLRLSKKFNACVRGDDGEIYRRSERGFECYTPKQGWVPLEEYHRGRPDWAPAMIQEIARRKTDAGLTPAKSS